MTENPPTPPAVLEERQRITDLIDKRIASWVVFHEDYPEVIGPFVTLSELDYIRSVVNASTPTDEPDNRR